MRRLRRYYYRIGLGGTDFGHPHENRPQVWGHEHKLAIYDRYSVPDGIEAHGRCVGHSGMPVERGDAPESNAIGLRRIIVAITMAKRSTSDSRPRY